MRRSSMLAQDGGDVGSGHRLLALGLAGEGGDDLEVRLAALARRDLAGLDGEPGLRQHALHRGG